MERVLQKVFGNSGMAYRVEQKQIVLTPKDDIPVEKDIPKTGMEQEQHIINGTVSDVQGPMPGVSIYIKDSDRGTFSGADGTYQIMAAPTDILVFSYIGYRTVERTVGSQTILNIELQEDVTELNEVVLNAGYYKTTEKTRTGSIAKVTAEEIEHQPVISPLMALQGRVAGLEITPTSGAPGIAPKIRIRGQNSLRILESGKTVPGVLTEGNYPLYIIDGIPINSSPVISRGGSITQGGYDPLSAINPENIESIEVLKDADATAIYGSRGANGIILITTKQGKGISKEKSNLDFSMYRGIGSVANRIDLLNTQQYLEMRKEAFANDGVEPNPNNTAHSDINGSWDQNRYTDWQKVLLGGTSDITDIQGNVSGGNTNTFYRLGGSLHKETLLLPGDFGYNRVSGHLHVNHTSDNQRFRASVSINYSVGKHNVTQENLVNAALTLAPNAPKLYDENGELNWELNDFGRETWTNPLAGLERTTNSDNRNLVANGNLEYLLLTGLTLKTNFGYTELNFAEKMQTPLTSFGPFLRPYYTPSAMFNSSHRNSVLIEPQLRYQKKIKDHRLDVIIGATYQENTDELLQIQGREYTSDLFLESLEGAGNIQILRDISEEYKYNAVFSRLGYSFKDRYLLNLTGRRDGSSRFGPGKRFGNFGAVGAAWIFSDEPWIKRLFPFLSSGKLRGSYGITGNDQIGNYQFLDLYRFSGINYQNQTSLSPNALFNPDFQWEKTKKLETSLAMGFAENRLSMEVSWYRNRSSNQLIQRTLPAMTGFSSVNDNFSEATVENSGWEFLLRGDIARTGAFQWTTSANMTVSRNKLLEFPGIEDSPYATVFKVGEPLSIQRLYTWLGVDPETGTHQFLDVNDDGVINDEDKQFSNALDRDFYGGLNNSLRYKGLELSFLFQFSKQNANYMPSGTPGYSVNQPSYVLRRWQSEGDLTDVQRFSQTSTMTLLYSQLRQSDANIEDASFLRLKTLSLSYFFPENVIEHMGLKQLKVFVQGQNLFTISGYSGLDPETGYALPPLRMITTGIQLQF
nr:SusC/RagA family TonB-linked outer membrane protein [Sinomicrobium pectinilyticum]